MMILIYSNYLCLNPVCPSNLSYVVEVDVPVANRY